MTDIFLIQLIQEQVYCIRLNALATDGPPPSQLPDWEDNHLRVGTGTVVWSEH